MQPSPTPSQDPTQLGSPTSSPASTLVVVRVRVPVDATIDDIRKVAHRVRESFLGVPGLQRKYFSYSSERREVVNVYIWHDGVAAARVREPEFVAKIRAAYAGEPDITFAEVLAIADSKSAPRQRLLEAESA